MKTGIKLMIIFSLTGGLCACAHSHATEAPPAPVTASDPFSAMIRFYQGPLDHLSAVRRGECPMVPSCSQYARQAIGAYGPLKGWVMAHDRLLRCGRDETDSAPRVLVNGKWKYFDPVESNAFWY